MKRFPLLKIRDKTSVNSYAFQTLFEFIRLLIHNFEDLLIFRFHLVLELLSLLLGLLLILKVAGIIFSDKHSSKKRFFAWKLWNFLHNPKVLLYNFLFSVLLRNFDRSSELWPELKEGAMGLMFAVMN